MVIRPAARSLALGCPGLFLTAIFGVFGAQELFVGGPAATIVLLAILAISLAMWLPFVIRLFGTRLMVDGEGIELRRLFGLRRRRIMRSDIRRVDVKHGNVMAADGALGGPNPEIPVAYYDVVDMAGRRWMRLSTWFWRGSDCERLRNELSGVTRPASVSAQARVPQAEGFTAAARTLGCVIQVLSALFGFAIGLVIAASVTHLSPGRSLGELAVPGFTVGYAIGSASNLSPRIYSFLTRQLGARVLVARIIAIASMFLLPIVLWIVALIVTSVVLTILFPG